MKKMGSVLCLAAAAFALQACVTGGSGGDNGPEPAAGRPHKAPTVAYLASDSLVAISMLGSREGDEASYWIYRNDTLLEMPDFAGKDSGSAFAYRLIDSLKAAGEYTYYVRYGSSADSLSGKSNAFTYSYAGPSPSGHIRAQADSYSSVMATLFLYPRSDRHPGGARFERRIGPKGETEVLDSLEGLPGIGGSAYAYADTAFVSEDTVLYYRASAWDAQSEEWLEPTAWDTIRIRNKTWDYLPAADIRNEGSEVRAYLSAWPAGTLRPALYLCRNRSQSRSGRVRVDSAKADAYSQVSLVLYDAPDTGAYWYWIEAVDQFGRESLRSAPKQVHFTGNPVGPAISSVIVSGSSIQIRFPSGAAFADYVIQRAQDTAKAPADADTVSGYSGDILANDRPAADGYWYYRVIGVSMDGTRSDPGPWSRSDFYRFLSSYPGLSALILNRGDRVEATVTSSSATYSQTYQILFRSKYPSGKDSVAVDTVLIIYPMNGKLVDTPSVGTWYYHVLQVTADPTAATPAYRSPLTRIDFTGKRMGPAIQYLQVNTGSITVSIASEPDLAAWILERSHDGKGDWSAIDTIPIGTVTRSDRPPETGFWQYRTRGVLPNLQSTEPGPPARTSTSWTYGQNWSYSISATVANLGTRVEATGSLPSSYAAARLMRGPTPDYMGGTKVDSISSTYSFTFKDTPPKGTWYYWVEQPPSDALGSMGYRSVAAKVEFTGAPEIVALYRTASGVQVTLPRAAAGDTLELWRANGKPENADDYIKVKFLASYGGYSEYLVDDTVDKKAPAFYSYRLAIVHEGQRSDLGAYKTFYYEP